MNTWTATWNASTLLKGRYLIAVQAVDNRTLHDDGVPDAPVDHRTFSYVVGSTDPATLGQIYSNDWSWNTTTRSWVQGTNIGWRPGQESTFPLHAAAMTPSSGEDWFGNPDATGTQLASTGIDPTLNACGIAPFASKLATASAVTVGDVVNFTISVINPAGNIPLTLTRIEDVLPAGFTYKTGSTTGIFGTADPANNGGGLLTWSGNQTIPADASYSLTFSATAQTTGAYSNSASILTSEFGTLLTAPVQVGVGASALSISKMPSAYTATPGTTLTYTLTYANPSPVNASNVVLSDALPVGLDYVVGSCSGGCVYTAATRTLSWNVGNLAAGEGPYTLSFQATVANPYSGTVVSENSVSIASDQTAPAIASASVYIDTPHPQLTLKKTANKILVDPAAAAPTNQITFTLAYANSGNATATSVVLSDVLPTGLTFVTCTGGCDHPPGPLCWPPPPPPPGPGGPPPPPRHSHQRSGGHYGQHRQPVI